MDEKNESGRGCGPNDTCCWVKRRKKLRCIICETGTCVRAVVLRAKHSEFYDKQLEEATEKISEIIGGIRAAEDGRSLSFIMTRMGIMLAWVEHGEEGSREPDDVTVKDDNSNIAEALGLIDWEEQAN